MSRLIAIEWDDSQILIASAIGSGKRLVFDQAFEVDLDESSDQTSLKDELISILENHKVTKGEATVVIGRSGVEMRQFSVPIVPDNELPDIVRFQAKSHFTSINDKWQLDFVKIASRDKSKIEILAAAISPQLIEQIEEGLEGTGVVVKHIVLRPFAAAALMRDRLKANKGQLIVDCMADETDLTVTLGADVLLTRTVRTPSTYDATAAAGMITQEIRRTMAAASNQLDGQKVESVIICGRAENHTEFKAALENDLKISVDFFQPFEAVSVRSSLAKNLPEHLGRFAPLLGSLVDQAEGSNHTIDFLNPRRAEVSHTGRDRAVLWASVAAIAFVVIFAAIYMILSSKESEITKKQAELNQLRNFNTDTKQVVGETELIDDWVNKQVIWLDELDELSNRTMFADNLILDNLFGASTQSNRNAGKPSITLKGKMQSRDVESQVVRSLETRPYQVYPKSFKDVDDSLYPHEFQMTVFVTDGEEEISDEEADKIHAENEARQKAEDKKAEDKKADGEKNKQQLSEEQKDDEQKDDEQNDDDQKDEDNDESSDDSNSDEDSNSDDESADDDESDKDSDDED